jgi:uncharacterized membrane protein YgaE (UPF0421/DUF939 family)
MIESIDKESINTISQESEEKYNEALVTETNNYNNLEKLEAFARKARTLGQDPEKTIKILKSAFNLITPEEGL